MKSKAIIYDIGQLFHDETYARAHIHIPKEFLVKCEECGYINRRKDYSPMIEWRVEKYESGSDQVGDFTWYGNTTEVMVTQRVRDCFEEHYDDCKFGPIEMYEDPKLVDKKRCSSRQKPSIRLPYTGPPLWDLIITSWCDLDLEASGKRFDWRCSTCGRARLETVRPRPIVVVGDSWHGYQLFRLHELKSSIFITEEVKRKIGKMKFTNLEIRERGYIG